MDRDAGVWQRLGDELRLVRCIGCFVRPNVRINRRAEAGRLGPVGENVPRTANRAKAACRSASG